MKNRTCGECRFHHRDYHYCQADKECKSIYPESPACDNFAERTIAIGDKIRALSDEDLAELFVYRVVYNEYDDEGWDSTLFSNTIEFSSRQKALEATLEELRREVKDEQE